MAGFHHCVTAVETAAGRELKESELEAIFGRMQGRMRRYQAEGMSPTDAAVRAGKELGDEMRVAGAIAKRNKLLNVARRRELEGRIRSGKEAADIRAILTGREGRREGDALSVDATSHGLQAEVLGPFVDKLRQAGLVRVLSRGDNAFDRDVVRELWSIENGGKPATKNSLARRAAEIINETQERTRLMQNEAGAWIGKLDQYVTRQSHDMDKIRASGFEAWRDYIVQRLDVRTFDTLPETTPKAVDDYLRSVYNALSSGVHDTSRGATAWGKVGSGTGPANLAKRASAERKLFFKDADAWADYNQEYGKGSLFNSVRSGLEAGARNTALMRTLGPNPEAMFQTISDAAMDAAVKRNDLAAVDALKGTFNAKIMDAITGEASIPGNATWGSITAVATAWQTLTKLGGVLLSSAPDLAVNAAALRHNGVGLFESFGGQLRALLPKGKEGREVADLAGVGIDGVLGNVASRYSAADGVRGKTAKLVDLFHKLNGLEWWTESLKYGVGTMLTHNLGRNASADFAALAPRLQVTLGRYGIGAAEWDAARATAAKAADGRMHLLPSAIDDATLRTKLSTYVQDQVRVAMTEPDAYSRAASTLGTQAGTIEGAAARLLMQFKSYPVTFMRRSLGRELYRNGDGGNFRLQDIDVGGLSLLMASTTLLGYASMEMKNLAKGRNPRTADADDAGDYAKMVFAAMAQGGGMGIYGDFLFGDSSRMGAGPVMSLFGPTAGTLDDVGKEVQTLRKWLLEGDPQAGKDARAGALGLIKDNAPFTNLFYTRAVTDYMLWYRLMEAANPGYLARYEDRVRREQGQTFMISPRAAMR